MQFESHSCFIVLIVQYNTSIQNNDCEEAIEKSSSLSDKECIGTEAATEQSAVHNTCTEQLEKEGVNNSDCSQYNDDKLSEACVQPMTMN